MGMFLTEAVMLPARFRRLAGLGKKPDIEGRLVVGAILRPLPFSSAAAESTMEEVLSLGADFVRQIEAKIDVVLPPPPPPFVVLPFWLTTRLRSGVTRLEGEAEGKVVLAVEGSRASVVSSLPSRTSESGGDSVRSASPNHRSSADGYVSFGSSMVVLRRIAKSDILDTSEPLTFFVSTVVVVSSGTLVIKDVASVKEVPGRGLSFMNPSHASHNSYLGCQRCLTLEEGDVEVLFRPPFLFCPPFVIQDIFFAHVEVEVAAPPSDSPSRRDFRPLSSVGSSVQSSSELGR